MAKSQKKKSDKKRVDKGKIDYYWNHNHPRNMLRRALRIYKRFGDGQARSFAALHSNNCGHCVILSTKLEIATR